MIETTTSLFIVSSVAMMIVARLVQELLASFVAKAESEARVVHSVVGTRARLTVYHRRCQKLDKLAHNHLMGMGATGARAVLDARRAVSKIDEWLTSIELLVQLGDSGSLEGARSAITQLNGCAPRSRRAHSELHYAWESELLTKLDRLSNEIEKAVDRLSTSQAA